jgi:hypothetical protein
VGVVVVVVGGAAVVVVVVVVGVGCDVTVVLVVVVVLVGCVGREPTVVVVIGWVPVPVPVPVGWLVTVVVVVAVVVGVGCTVIVVTVVVGVGCVVTTLPALGLGGCEPVLVPVVAVAPVVPVVGLRGGTTVPVGGRGVSRSVVAGWVVGKVTERPVEVLVRGDVTAVAGCSVAGVGAFVVVVVGAGSGTTVLGTPWERPEADFTRCWPPKPTRRAAMTAATTPIDASGATMRFRMDSDRACFGSGFSASAAPSCPGDPAFAAPCDDSGLLLFFLKLIPVVILRRRFEPRSHWGNSRCTSWSGTCMLAAAPATTSSRR